MTLSLLYKGTAEECRWKKKGKSAEGEFKSRVKEKEHSLESSSDNSLQLGAAPRCYFGLSYSHSPLFRLRSQTSQIWSSAFKDLTDGRHFGTQLLMA